MANLETPPTPQYDANMFSNLSEMARIIKDNDDALLADIENGGGGATDEDVAGFISDPNSDTRDELDSLYAGQGATDADVAAFVADPNSDTRDELDTLYAGQGGGTVEIGSVTFASGYGNYSSAYTVPRVIKTNGRLCTLEAGLIACPSSFAAQTYYTVGTVQSGFAPTDSGSNLTRMGVAHLYHGTGSGDILTPGQFRINGAGQLQFLITRAVEGSGNANLYLIFPSLSWSRVA